MSMSLDFLICSNFLRQLDLSDFIPMKLPVWRSVIVLLLLALSPLNIQADVAAKKPNIFVIFSDDVTRKDLGFSGNTLVRTPRLNRLASEGMVLTNVFTATPQCVPSRASLYTGLYSFRHGAHPNWSEVKPETKSLPHYMKALGYRVVLMGKRHFKPVENFPFEWYEDGIRPLGPGPDLKRLLENPGEKPLCLFYVKFGTHVPWPHNKSQYDPEKVGFQPYLVDTPETRKMRANYYSAITEMDEAVGKVLDLLAEKGQLDESLLIWTADHGAGWPHERDMLYDPGINSPFIARWPGRIKPGTANAALISYVDLVPTLIDIAGGSVERVVSECGGKKLDGKSFLPVLLGEKQEHRSEIYATNSWNVMSLYPIRAIRTKTHKFIWNVDSQFIFPSDWDNPAPHPDFVAQRPVWKSWEQKAKTDSFAAERVRAELYRPPEELYDLRNDPFEMRNIAGEPSQKPTLESLRKKLNEWMREQGDAGDSAYHKDKEQGRSFLDEIYIRRIVVNLRMTPTRSTASIVSTVDKVDVELSCPIWKAEIRYTLNGDEPTGTSQLYTGPFILDSPLTIKAKAFWKGGSTPVKEVKFDGVDFRFLYENTHYKPLYH